MAANGFILQLKRDGATVATVETACGGDPLTIGRAADNTLQIPATDHAVSSHHARFFWKRSALFLEDLGSRNGTYRNTERLVRPVKVAAGDVFAVGSTSILVSRSEKAAERKAGTGFHRLEWLSGDNAGKMVEIRPKEGAETFTIGLDPDNDLLLPDMLVSRHHAYLTMSAEGECWLHDTSRNGTAVNGDPLHGKERLLKDNDRISIAYFDFRFLDRAVTHTRFFFRLKMAVLFITLLAMGALYVMWTTTSASVEDHLRAARSAAATKNFEGAKQEIVAARLTRDADRYRAGIDALDGQVERWRTTAAAWARAKEMLAADNPMAARKVLDPLAGAAADAWMWNGTTAIEERKAADFAVTALRQYYDVLDVVAGTESGLPEQQADLTAEALPKLDGFLASSKAAFVAEPALAPLRRRLESSRERLNGIRAGFADVDGGIAKLDAMNPDFASLVRELRAIASKSNQVSAVKNYVEKFVLPVEQLAAARTFIAEELSSIHAMRFADVLGRKDELKLPKKELCARHPQLSAHRTKLEAHHLELQKFANNLQSMVNGLTDVGVTVGATPTALTRALDLNSWRKALSFDCFAGKPPSARRRQPSCAYDELIGVEYTFESLRALPENYSGWCLRLIGFKPDVIEMRGVYEHIDTFVSFLESKPSWLARGEMAELLAHCRGLQKSRSELKAHLSGWQSDDPRASLVAKFYAVLLADGSDRSARRQLAKEFKNIQRKVSALSEKYEELSDPIEQFELRRQMLSSGFPGDGQLHSKWVQQYERSQK